MSKKIKVIFKKDFLNIGKKNEIVNLSKGYVFNYLIPQGIVEVATKNKIKHFNMFKVIKIKQLKQNEIKAESLYSSLTTIKKITITKKVGENYLIFGSINEKDIINQLSKYSNINLDKKQIKVPDIKKIGAFYIEINLFNRKLFNLKLNISPANI